MSENTVSDISYIDLHAYARNSDVKLENSQETQSSTIGWACNKIIPDLFGGRVGRVVGTYKDEGKSASRKKVRRPDFERLMSDIEANRVRVLVVVNLSRFSRLHHVDAIRLHTKLYEYGVTLVSIDDRKIISIEELTGFIEVALKSHNDHEYARTVARNTLRGSIRAVEKGQPHVNAAPYGMAKLFIDEAGREHRYPRSQSISKPKGWRGHLIPGDEVEVRIVRWVFQTYADRDVSFSWIATALNRHEDAAVRVGPRGNGWSMESVRHMLQNDHYAGRVYIGRRPAGEHYRASDGDIIETKKYTGPTPVVVPMAYQTEPIIPDDLFQNVQRKLNRNASRNAKPQTAGEKEGYPLTGCLVCGQCGYSMFAMQNKGNPRYQCRSATRHTSLGCGHWSIREDELLPYLLHAIDREVLRKLNDTPSIPDDPEQDAIRRAVEEINAKIEVIKGRMRTVSVDAVVALTDAISTLTAQRADLLARRRESDHLERVRSAVERWEELVAPYLIPICTGDYGVGDPAVTLLGIQEEVDRCFNLTLARPSALRELFHKFSTRVECWFRETGGSGGRKSYELDKARLKAEINGRAVTSIGSPGC